MILSITQEEIDRFRKKKKKVTFPRSYKYIILAEHTHLSPEFMLSYMLKAYALKLYALNCELV